MAGKAKKNGKSGARPPLERSRSYRNRINGVDLKGFTVRVKETDLHVQSVEILHEAAREAVIRHRTHIESHIRHFPDFAETLSPWNCDSPVAPIVADMIRAGLAAGVGPMAAVAGAVAEHVGRDLLKRSDRIIVENGGDLFIKLDRPVVVGVYAGASSLSMRLGIRMDSSDSPVSICTSSGTIGHSLSLGMADAVCVKAMQCPLADAAATAIANRVRAATDIPSAIEFGKRIPDVEGILVVIADKIGVWGEMELVPL